MTRTIADVQTTKLPPDTMPWPTPIDVAGDRAIFAMGVGSFHDPRVYVLDLKTKAIRQYSGGSAVEFVAGNHVGWLEGSCDASPAPDANDPSECRASLSWSVKLLDLDTGRITTPLTAKSARLDLWPTSSSLNDKSILTPALGLIDDGFVTAVEDATNAQAWTIEAFDFAGTAKWSLRERHPITNLTAKGNTVVWKELDPTPAGGDSRSGYAGRGWHSYALFGAPGLPIDLGQPNGAVAGPGYALVSQLRAEKQSPRIDEVIVRAGQPPLVVTQQDTTDNPVTAPKHLIWWLGEEGYEIDDVATGARTIVMQSEPITWGANDGWLIWVGSGSSTISWASLSGVVAS